VHWDDAHPDEPFGVVGNELCLPIVEDLCAGLHYLDVRVAQDSQHAGGIEHLGLDASLLLEAHPHFRHVAGLPQPLVLCLFGGGVRSRNQIADYRDRCTSVA
jgi:hypothetical protein